MKALGRRGKLKSEASASLIARCKLILVTADLTFPVINLSAYS